MSCGDCYSNGHKRRRKHGDPGCDICRGKAWIEEETAIEDMKQQLADYDPSEDPYCLDCPGCYDCEDDVDPPWQWFGFHDEYDEWLAALQKAAHTAVKDAIEAHHKAGHKVAVWRNGRIEWI